MQSSWCVQCYTLQHVYIDIVGGDGYHMKMILWSQKRMERERKKSKPSGTRRSVTMMRLKCLKAAGLNQTLSGSATETEMTGVIKKD